MQTHTLTQTYADPHTHAHRSMQTHTHTHTHTDLCRPTHTRTPTYAHTHTHTDTQGCAIVSDQRIECPPPEPQALLISSHQTGRPADTCQIPLSLLLHSLSLSLSFSLRSQAATVTL